MPPARMAEVRARDIIQSPRVRGVCEFNKAREMARVRKEILVMSICKTGI